MQTLNAATDRELEPGSRQEVAWQVLTLCTQDSHDCRVKDDERRPSQVLNSQHKWK